MSDYRDERLQAYLDGEFSPDERAAFERELRQEPELAEELARLKRVAGMVSGLPAETAPANLADSVLEQVHRSPASPGQRWLPTLAAAAIVFLALMPVGYQMGFNAGAASAPQGAEPGDLATEADAGGAPAYLVLVHGIPEQMWTGEDQGTWRRQQYTRWSETVRRDGRLVSAENLDGEVGRGIWSDGSDDEGQAWYSSSWTVPTAFAVVRAWTYDEAVNIARTLPQLEFGGSVTVRRIEALEGLPEALGQ